MSGYKFRPELHVLEAREVPALNVLYNGADLFLTGTPAATGEALMAVANTGGNNFQVTDGALNLGTYHVTRDISLRLASFDRFVGVDLGGGTLTGNILIDVGAGHRDPDTISGVSVYGNAGASAVAGDVTFRGGSGTEAFSIAADGPGTTLDIGGSVRATGKPVAAPLGDTLVTSPQSRVHGNVVTSRISYTRIFGVVDGDVTANAADSPGGMGLDIYGTVHGDVTATGGATAGYASYAFVGGTVDGDVRLNLTGGRASAAVGGGTVGGDWTVHHTGGGSVALNLAGAVKGDFTVVTSDDAAADETDVYIDYFVGGDFRFQETGKAGSCVVQMTGYVVGDASIDLGGPKTQVGIASLAGAIGGSATVTGQGKTVIVRVAGYPGNSYAEFGVPGTTAVTGDLTVKLGNGNNTLDISQYDYTPQPKTIGGKLTYTGGSGTDAVTISGKFGFQAKIDTGAGNDTVAFAPDATVGSLTIDFGAGTDTWVPPGVIAFPVKLKRLP